MTADERDSANDDDLGPPVAALSDLDEDVPGGFVGRVIGSIRRRHLASDLASLWWTGLGQVLIEMVKLVAGLLRGGDQTEGGTEE